MRELRFGSVFVFSLYSTGLLCTSHCLLVLTNKVIFRKTWEKIFHFLNCASCLNLEGAYRSINVWANPSFLRSTIAIISFPKIGCRLNSWIFVWLAELFFWYHEYNYEITRENLLLYHTVQFPELPFSSVKLLYWLVAPPSYAETSLLRLFTCTGCLVSEFALWRLLSSPVRDELFVKLL